MMGNNTSELQTFLSQIKPGPVPDDHRSDLIALLSLCWEVFDGTDDSKMEARKLSRIENPEWRPPILSFIIERHGGVVKGSTRAEIQLWECNLDDYTANFYPCGTRQIKEKAEPWKAEPVAEELAQIIIAGEEDPRLKWSGENRDRVQLLTSSVIPVGNNQTYSGRSKRLFIAIDKILSPKGWRRSRNNWEK